MIQIVNTSDQPVRTSLALAGFAPKKPVAEVEELAAPLQAANTAAVPDRVKPRRFDWRHAFQAGSASYSFPPHSVTVIRFQ